MPEWKGGQILAPDYLGLNLDFAFTCCRGHGTALLRTLV